MAARGTAVAPTTWATRPFSPIADVIVMTVVASLRIVRLGTLLSPAVGLVPRPPYPAAPLVPTPVALAR